MKMLFRISRLARNIVTDARYGGFLGGTKPTRFGHLGAKDTANTDYRSLEYSLGPQLRQGEVVADVGCGKGRVINWLLSIGLANKIYGIELDPEVGEATRRRLSKFAN